ncbi:MAG: hypothetical protein M5U28_19590 [Sandaracinaceae bacterium]|nr:hypothetical protein [Sandaracinaceae bacterium]
MSFALVHWTAFLSRKRSVDSPFKTPLFPLVPVVGGVACAALAVFQAIAVPAAGGITAVWLGLGVLLYMALFAGRAQAVDAFHEALDPRIAMTRGRSPLVLAPVANPASAAGIIALANALAPPVVGRVVLLTILRKSDARVTAGEAVPRALRDAQSVLLEGLTVSLAEGHTPEAIVTIADDPWAEIARAVALRRCESLLLGVAVDRPESAEALESLLNEVQCDVVLLRAPTGWSPSSIERVVVPIGGRGGHDELRARLLGSLGRTQRRPVRFVRVVPEDTPAEKRETLRAEFLRFAEEETHGVAEAAVVASDAVVSALAASAGAGELLILGLQRHEGRRLLGEVALQVARETDAAVLMISHRG